MIYHKKLLLDQFTPIAQYDRLKVLFKNEISFLFESAVNNERGNYSYIVVGAREKVWHENNKSYYQDENQNIIEVDSNPLSFLKKHYEQIDKQQYNQISKDINVGFVDGFIGYIGYDMVKEFEPTLKKHMNNLKDLTKIPDLILIRPKLILAFSHKSSTLTLVSSLKSMQEKFDEIEKLLLSNYSYLPLKKAQKLKEGFFDFEKEEFMRLVEKSKEMIKSGDVFQILMSNRFIQPAVVDRLSFYRVLRSKNPSPYLFLLEFDKFAIAGSSPEVMVQLSDGKILLRPIAGTRKRGKNAKRDIELEKEMINDEKEVAEHIMLVDLGRNDVGRVAKAGSVKVQELMHVEKYSHVMHMVSDVIADIDDRYDMFDLFMATFTAGTMTGAPKVRAMELIADFEKFKRSFYSGAVGYFGFNGNMDSSITIRTALIKEDMIIFHAGAGVVADSKPELEFLEVNNKLAANISSFNDLLDIDDE
jgi:anthranilate synthase component 1